MPSFLSGFCYCKHISWKSKTHIGSDVSELQQFHSNADMGDVRTELPALRFGDQGHLASERGNELSISDESVGVSFQKSAIGNTQCSVLIHVW